MGYQPKDYTCVWFHQFFFAHVYKNVVKSYQTYVKERYTSEQKTFSGKPFLNLNC